MALALVRGIHRQVRSRRLETLALDDAQGAKYREYGYSKTYIYIYIFNHISHVHNEMHIEMHLLWDGDACVCIHITCVHN